MIRDVEDRDIARITQIYNWYIVNGVETFETEPLTVEQMRSRVRAISATHPYIVAEEDGEVVAYAYAHPWKERAAYAATWETTVYADHACVRRGLGTALMRVLIDRCRRQGCRVLIACITGCNAPSHAQQAGFLPGVSLQGRGHENGTHARRCRLRASSRRLSRCVPVGQSAANTLITGPSPPLSTS